MGGLGQTTPVDTEVMGYDQDSQHDTKVITDIVAPMQITSPPVQGISPSSHTMHQPSQEGHQP